MILLITLLFIKHFICDFLYQPKFQWANKGTYGHPGGIVHAGQHAIATLAILLFFTSPLLALGLSFFELVAHYHIDWAKMNINKTKGWGANTHEQFWQLLGVDQLLHQLTYVVILCLI
jgi:hypothetical protein